MAREKALKFMECIVILNTFKIFNLSFILKNVQNCKNNGKMYEGLSI
jgi:hypothetical protein